MSSPKVSYAYADGSANTIRPTSVTYPDGRVLSYDYGSSGGQNDKLSRIDALGFDGTDNLVQPAYLGMGTQVRTSYSEPDVRWDLATGTSPNPYAGLDRFGRVIDNKWTNYSSSTTLDQIKYGYDRASNRIWRENPVAKAQTTPKYFDELYGYDGSNRLSLMERGQLAGSPPSSITNKQFAQDWGLDPTGNWKVFKEDDNGDGTWDLNQTRTSNPVNEITAINETAGPSWATPGYDNAGNMTTIPRPAEPTGDFTGIYDAWNRLVELQGLDDTVVGRYEYDGLTRRVVKHTFPGWEELEAADWDAMTEEDWNGLQLTQAHRRDYYYNAIWQILEERVENDTAFDRQYVWGLQYIDGLVFRDRQLTSGVERNYALQDANWNVTAITDDNGAVVERYSYTAYGVPSFQNPDFTTAANYEAYDWDVLYAGYKWDPESALYQVRFRYLQPAIGSWVSRDPKGYSIVECNLLRYLMNACIIYVDPSGLEELSIVFPAGELFWEIIPKGMGKGNGVDFYSRFVPDDENCTCNNIAYVQVVLEHTVDGVRVYPNNDAKYFTQLESPTGSRIDHAKDDDDPYYSVRWTPKFGWIKAAKTMRLGVSSPDEILQAKMDDFPQDPVARSRAGEVVYRYETIIVCIDNGRVLGGLAWGFKIADMPNSMVVITRGTKKDANTIPSREWYDAVEAWNSFADKMPGWHKLSPNPTLEEIKKKP